MTLAPGVRVNQNVAPRRPHVRALVPALLLAALALPAPAWAQQQPSVADKETARALMDKGDERMDARDYAAAVKAYGAADAIMHLPMTGVALALAQAAAGLLLEARDLALQVKQLPAHPGESPAYARARADAAALADKLAERIPSIQVVIEHPPPGVVVAIDAVTLAAAAAGEQRKVNPGVHVVTVSAVGFAPAHVDVTTTEGAALVVPITLQPAPTATTLPTPPPPVAPARSGGVSPLVVVGFGVGGAGLLVGAITGGLSLSRTATLKVECATGAGCTAGDLASANTLANVANVTIPLGLAGVGLGVVGLVLARQHDKTPAPAARFEPLVGPGTLGLRGTF